MTSMTFGARLSELARQDPHRPALILAHENRTEDVINRHELDAASNSVARMLVGLGLGPHRWIVVAFRNCSEHVITAIAGWKAGACVIPLNPDLADPERDSILDLIKPAVIAADWVFQGDDGALALSRGEIARSVWEHDSAPLPDRIPEPGKAIASGGSTGRPKVIVSRGPWTKEPGRAAGDVGRFAGFSLNQVQLVTTQLSHNMPFSWSHLGLFDGHTIVLMEKFQAEYALDLVERYSVNWTQFVPIIMQRIARVENVKERDFSSVEAIWHCGAPCAPWLKRFWIRLLGPSRVRETFGSAEGVGRTDVSGEEWLERPGTVGRPVDCDLAVLTDDGSEAGLGTTGEIFMRPHSADLPFEYIGSPPPVTTRDGYISVGDMGWVDEAGYLFPADRRTDLIITGGINVYPAEVEAALNEHPAVSDVAVIPLDDPEWGKRVHAVIESRVQESRPGPDDLARFCRERLASYKCPKSYEFVDALPRDAAGKIRRSALAAARRSSSDSERLERSE